MGTRWADPHDAEGTAGREGEEPEGAGRQQEQPGMVEVHGDVDQREGDQELGGLQPPEGQPQPEMTLRSGRARGAGRRSGHVAR